MNDQSGKSVADLLGDLEFYQEQLATYRWRVRDRDATIERLRAALAEAERDAERYRWLRDENTKVALVIDKVTGYFEDGIHMYEYRSGIDLDTAIDAAMAREES